MSKPIVLCDIPGLGLSSSWKGNAIASANPENFNSFLNQYLNFVISPLRIEDAPLFDNRQMYLESLLSGVRTKSNRELVNDSISSEELFNNSVVNSSLNEVTKSNSAVHLVGNLGTGRNEFGDINHLLALLKMIKQKNIFRVYIHLLLDNSEGTNFADINEKLNLLSSKIESIGVGEIATICGMRYLKDWNQSRLEFINFSKGIKSIIQGRGNVYLSAAQAISQNQNRLSSPDHFPPSVISYKGKPVGVLTDLDCVIFFNHNNSIFSNLTSALVSGGRSGFAVPKFLSVLAFFDDMTIGNGALKSILIRSKVETLAEILSRKNISQNYISDSNALIDLRPIFEGFSGSSDIEQTFYPTPSLNQYFNDPREIIFEIFKHTANSAASGRTFTFTLIPALDLIASGGNFNQAVEAMKIIDEYLLVLAKKMLLLDGILIITSTYGNAEKMVHRNEYEYLNRRTLSPTPFIVISNQTKVGSRSDSLENKAIYDIIHRKNNLIDIAPTVLGLLNIPIPNSMTGVSLIGANRS